MKRSGLRSGSCHYGSVIRFRMFSEQQNTKISELLSGAKPAGQNPISFTDEMMVMSGFSSQDMHTLLDGMRNNGCPVRLKCIVTETNKSWTATRLHKELIAEDQAMRKRTSKR